MSPFPLYNPAHLCSLALLRVSQGLSALSPSAACFVPLTNFCTCQKQETMAQQQQIRYEP